MPPDKIVWREVGDEIVILDLRTSLYWTLNGSATVLWSSLIDGATTSEMVQRLVDEFDVEVQKATHDVDTFIASCQEQDLDPAGLMALQRYSPSAAPPYLSLQNRSDRGTSCS